MLLINLGPCCIFYFYFYFTIGQFCSWLTTAHVETLLTLYKYFSEISSTFFDQGIFLEGLFIIHYMKKDLIYGVRCYMFCKVNLV